MRRPTIKGLFLTICTSLLLMPGLLWANPQGGNVVAGSATISQPNATTTQINQSSNKAIINWQSFSIGQAQTTQFIQPGASSIILNRVIGVDPSSIQGVLKGNGQVWLINPSGIVFGPTARVDVAGLVATTSNISNSDFMSGNYRFTAPAGSRGAVINQGVIRVADQGIVALVAPGVENSGVIQARMGKVTLASSTNFTVDLYGDQLINFTVGSTPVQNKAVAPDGRVLNDAVSNKGTIIADSGKVMLAANVARNVVDNAVSMGGVIRANTAVKGKNGDIVLLGGNGDVKVSGKILAMGKATDTKGGKVKITGKTVKLVSTAKVNTSGKAGGGEILVGGDYQGKNSAVPNADYVYVDPNTLIKADALSQGDGGKVILWSNENTQFNGTISAKGGPEGGNGGFVEVSSKNKLDYHGNVDLSAPKGETGQLLLDPRNITIQGSGSTTNGFANPYIAVTDSSIVTVTDLVTALGSANVTIQTSGSGAQSGDITVADPINWVTGNSLTLNAHNNINVNSNITNTGGANLNLRSDYDANGNGTVTFGSATISLTGGVGGKQVNIFYNPSSYITPTNFAPNVIAGTLTPYMLVNTSTNLQNVSTNLAGIYALGKTIDMTGQALTPIGNNSTPFTGIFNGQNYAINNLTINNGTSSPAGDYTALFGEIGTTGNVNNLIMRNANITGAFRSGILSGYNLGTISNVNISGTLTGNNNIGIIAGENASTGSITNASSFGSVTIPGRINNTAGGLVGYNLGAISNSFSYASAFGGDEIGGLVGRNETTGTINTSYAAGAADGSNLVGGLVGRNLGSIANAYATGAVNVVTLSAGGLIGTNSGTVSNVYSSGAVTGLLSLGGLVGVNLGTVTNSFWNTTLSGLLVSAAGLGRTTAQMLAQATFTGAGWDFVNTWNSINTFTSPYLRAISVGVSGTTPSGATTIRFADNGVLIGSAVSNAGGNYGLVVPNTHVVLAYLDNAPSSNVSNIVFELAQSGSILSATNFTNQNVRVINNTTNPINNSDLSIVKGTLSDTDILYAVDSSNNLTIGNSGVSFTTSATTPYQLNGNLTTNNGAMTFGGPVTLANDVSTNSGTAATLFSSTLNGDYNLNTHTVSSNVTYTGAVGAITPLANLSSDPGGGAHVVSGGTVRTTGNQTYNFPVTLTAATTFSSLASGDISYANTINGGFALNVNTSGNTIFGGTPGGVTPLTSITTDAGGTTTFGGASAISTGAQTYNDVVLALGNINFTGTNITFNDRVDASGAGTHALQVTGNLILGGAGDYMGSVAPFTSTTVTGTSTLNAGNNGGTTSTISTTGGQTFTGAVTLGGDTTLTSSGSGNVLFGSTVSSPGVARNLIVDTGGITTFTGTVGAGANPLANLTTDAAGSTSVNTTAVTTTGAQTFNDPVTLGANTTFTSSGGNNLTFASTINGSGARTLTLNTTGTTTLGGAVGNVTPLTSVTTNAGGATNINGGSVTTTGVQTYNDAVSLGANTVSTSTGNSAITFASTLNGLFDLTVTTGGTTTFSNTVGGTNPLASLLTNGGGTTAINTTGVTTSGAQTYSDAVTLGANPVLTSNAGSDITFDSTLSGAGRTLALNTTGNNIFNGVVGTLSSITTNAGGTTQINTGTVTTTGVQTYNDVVLSSTSALNLTGSTITFNNTVDPTGAGAHTLQITGILSLNSLGAYIGSVSPFTSTTVTGASTLAAGNNSGATPTVATTGAQTYTGAVTLGADTTLNSSGSGNILFSSTISSPGVARNLTVNTGGATTFSNTVGAGANPLASITTDALGTTAINTATVTTTGAQAFNDPVTLGANATFTSNGAGNLLFGNTIDSSGVSRTLTLNTTGTTILDGAIGNTLALTSITTNAGGSTNMNAGPVTTTGAQTYNDAMDLGANTVLTSTGGGAINLASTVNGAFDLTINTSGTGTLGAGVVGGVTPLTSITTNAGGTTSLNGAMTTTGAQTYNDAVSLGANTTLTSNSGGDITFGSTLSGARTLALNTTGNNIFNGAVATLTSITTNAGGTTQINTGTMTTSGVQTYNDIVLSSTSALNLTGSTITFNNTVDPTGAGAHTLQITGILSLNSLGAYIGSVSPFTSTTVTGASTLAAGNNGGTTPTIATTGAQTYTGAVTLGADTTLSSSGSGNILFSSTINSPTTARNLTVNTGGTTTFSNTVGSTNALASLTTDAPGTTAVNTNTVTTTGVQAFNDPVTLGAGATFTSSGGDNLLFGSTIDSSGVSRTLTLNTTGTTILNGAIGNTLALTNITTNAGGSTSMNAGTVTTNGAQTYNDAMDLGADTTLTGGSTIALASTVNGAHNLVVDASGTTTFGGAVGLSTPLISITTGNGGTTALNGGTFITTGAQTYNDAVTLGTGTVITSTAGGNLTFGGNITNNQTLTLNTSGANIFNATVGGTTAGTRLASLTTDAGGTTQLNSGLVRTNGAQTYNDAVILGADNTLTSSNGNAITFVTTLNGAQALTVNTAGVTIFGGAVGSGTPLTSLTTNGVGSTSINGGVVTTTGTQTYNDLIDLGANTTLNSTAGSVVLSNNLTGTNRNLTLNTATGITLTDNITLGTGILHLNPSSGGVNQTAGTISANGLLLTGSGNVNLAQTTNDVNTLAADIQNNLVYRDADDLTIGSISGTDGVTANGTVLINTLGNLTLNHGITAVPGIGNNSLVLVTAGNFINNAGSTPLDPGIGGRFLVYSVNPANNSLGGLLFDTKCYNTNFTSNPPAALPDQVSDMLLYNIAPTLTFSANNKNKFYGYTMPTLTYTVTGFIDGDTPSTAYIGVPGLSTTATITSVPSGYPILINIAGITSPLNYGLASTNANLAINPAPLTVTVNNVNRTQGQANPSFTASFSGFVLGQGPGNLGGSLNFNTAANTRSSPGAYTIDASGLFSSNYAIIFIPGVLQVIGATAAVIPTTANPSFVALTTVQPVSLLPLINKGMDKYVEFKNDGKETQPVIYQSPSAIVISY